MSATSTEPLHLHRLEISNFMRVSACTIDADGRHVVISGQNGSGKTSTLNAIWSTLKGASTRDTPEPVHQGKEKAQVRLDLGEYIVTRHWSGKSSRLVVTAADGSKIAKPQELLDGLLGKFSLDPVAFLDRRPQDQVDDVLSLAGVEPPVEKVLGIIGETSGGEVSQYMPRPGESADQYLLRLSADETGLVYQQRREAHRNVERKSAALAEQQQQLNSLGGPLGPKDDLASVAGTLKEIEALQAQAARRREAEAAAQRHQTILDASRSRLQALADQEKRLEGEIREFHRRIQDATSELNTIRARQAKGADVVAEVESDLAEAKAVAASIPDPTERIGDLQIAVAEWERGSAKIARRRAAAEQLERLGCEAAAAEAEHQRIDLILDQLRSLRAHLLDGVDLGVPGLSIGSGELKLNGVSFRQASQAESIRVACAVAMRQQPRLRLLRVDEAERLDSNSMAMLLELADRHGWQVVCAKVADNKSISVEILEA